MIEFHLNIQQITSISVLFQQFILSPKKIPNLFSLPPQLPFPNYQSFSVFLFDYRKLKRLSSFQNIIQIISMKKIQQYRLTLLEGDYFNAPKQDFFHSLFRHFSLLSWLSSASEVQILDKEHFYPEGKEVSVYTYTTKLITNPAFLVEFGKDTQSKTISYCPFVERQEMLKAINSNSLKSKVTVVFSMHDQTSKLNPSKKRAVIFIDISDEGNFFGCGVSTNSQKLSEETDKSYANVIHYPYKQPLNRRNKESAECHFNLAFQGGGAKGVSYVGVYKALEQLHRNIPISSVIGSSAGGILALAISSGMTPRDISQLCLQMDAIPKDKHFSKEQEITPEIQAQFDTLTSKLKSILHNFGIIQGSLFEQFTSSFCDIQTDNKILKLLQCVNPSIAELFSLQLKTPHEVSKGFFAKPELLTRRFNYYGILMAGMMRGGAVEDIAASCMVSFLQKHFDDYYLKDNPAHKERLPTIKRIINKWGFTTIDDGLFLSAEFREKVKCLTLREYYSITGIEFTCTSVDLDDQILRFFNHKTTPDLPVCKTVQMTGSFPVAFQAQKWRSEWGKYFVHYGKLRKEIDLTGHEFTDGGLLANFPIKYLDNQHMRPMYFSHRQHPSRTILYGFGLDQIADPEADNKQREQQKQLAIADLKQHLSSKFSKFKFIKNLIFSDSNSQLPQVALEQVPLFNFIIKLMRTFTVADYNLNIECFRKSIVETEVAHRVLQIGRNVKREIGKYERFDQLLETLQGVSKAKQKAMPNEVLSATAARLKQKLTDFENTENHVVQAIKSQALDSLYKYEAGRIRKRFAQSKEVNQLIQSLEGLYPEELFKMQSAKSVKEKLLSIINKIHEYFRGFTGSQLAQLTVIYSGMLDTQLETVSRIRDRLSDILATLRSSGSVQMDNSAYSELTFIDYQLVFDLISMQRKFFIVDHDFLKQIMEEIKQLDLPAISIDKEVLDHASRLQYQMGSILKNAKSNRLHLVLQSKQNSHLYYCGLYSILQEVLNHSHNQQKRIEMVTCADFHSVFAFLLAGGKKISNIRREMMRITDIINLEQGIEEEYASFKWAQTYSQEMNELLQLTWKDQYKLFDQVEEYLGDPRNQRLREDIRKMRTEYLYSKGAVTKAMEQVLAYVVDSAGQAEKIQDQGLRKKKLAQLLSLRNGPSGKDYMSKNKMISKNTQRLINKLMFHFEELITTFVLNNFLIPSAFAQFAPQQREQVWKGVLVRRLLSGKKLELYLKEKLEEMKLNSNTSLAEFYDFSPRKITLNFNLINKKEERLEIVNRFTRPNMPLWAAIVAAASMPYLLPAFACDEEWLFSPLTDSRMRKLVHYFFDDEDAPLQTFYIAGNYVSTLPLEFLTNQKIARENYTSKHHEELIINACQTTTQPTPKSSPPLPKFTPQLQSQTQSDSLSRETDFTCITFSFRTRTSSTNSYKYEASDKRFLSFSNLLNLGVDFLLGRFKNIQVGFRHIMRRAEFLKLLSTRIECHDNTIMYYYKDQTIKLPVRLGTLDFYKIVSSKQQNLNSCIYQAEFVVRGIFQNLHVRQDQKGFRYDAKKETYLQFQTRQDKILLQFPSKSKWNKNLSTIYRVFHRLSPDHPYQEYQQTPISVPNHTELLYFKFVFPNMQTMRLQEQEMELDFRKLTEDEEHVQDLIFRFNYATPEKKFLKGIQLDNTRLKTKVLPSIKSLHSENGENSATNLVRTTSMRGKRDNRWMQKQATGKCLIVRTLVSFKHNGLLCKNCTHHLSRPAEVKTSSELTAGHCGRCNNAFNLIGLQCRNGNCEARQQNRYCFQCLLVYLIARRQGQFHCTPYGHHFKHCSPLNNAPVALCHFCSAASSDYYTDQQCNINLCFKCSLILDSNGAIAL